MKVDPYTKFVLTVIAFCMVMNLFSNLIQPATARVQGTIVDVNIESIGGYRVYSQKLPVEVK